MKNAVSLLIVAIMLFSLCSCGSSDKSAKKKSEVSGHSDGIGILVDEEINESKVKKLKPADVEPDGITTLCYETLTKKQKSFYEYLLAGANDMTKGWFYCGKTTDDIELDISAAYRALIGDCPQLFWMPTEYIIATDGKKVSIAFDIDENGHKSEYRVSRKECKNMSKELDAAVNGIVAEARAYKGEYEKELFVHDYLCRTVTYDLNGGDMIYSSYGALVNGVCVCEGYSRAMQLIMQRLGIKCGLIYGEYDSSGHMWNYIQIEGDWYHLDVTWDKSEDFGAIHTYFNLSDKEIKKTHIISDKFDNQKDVLKGVNYNILDYTCSHDSCNYYVRTGRILNDDAKNDAAVIRSSYQNGAEFCEYRNDITSDEKEILNEAASLLYPEIQLKSYSKSQDLIIVFF